MGVYTENNYHEDHKDASINNLVDNNASLNIPINEFSQAQLNETENIAMEEDNSFEIFLLVSPRNSKRQMHSPSILRETPLKRNSNSLGKDNSYDTPTKTRRLNSRLFSSPPAPAFNLFISDTGQKEEKSNTIVGYVNTFASTVQEYREEIVHNISPNKLSEFNLSVISNGSVEETNSYHMTSSPMSQYDIKRYKKEFVELEKIGQGEFGGVYKCMHKIDGCIYAIKVSINPFQKSIERKTAIREAHANSAIGTHANLVRYFSSWIEDRKVHIQAEYCNGGSLADLIERNYQNKTHFTEKGLLKLGCQIMSALSFLHAQGVAHLDVKPGNILISQVGSANILENDVGVTYKLGDLGHLTKFHDQVDDGDSRYLAPELLQDNFDHTDRADIFSLALTLFEAAGGGSLPRNGEKWSSIRNNVLPYLENYSSDFNSLLKVMANSNPLERPASHELLETSYLRTSQPKSYGELVKELSYEKRKSERLERELSQASILLESYNLSKSKESNELSSSFTSSTNVTPPQFGSPTEINFPGNSLSQPLHSTPMTRISEGLFSQTTSASFSSEKCVPEKDQIKRLFHEKEEACSPIQKTPTKLNTIAISKRLSMDWSPTISFPVL